MVVAGVQPVHWAPERSVLCRISSCAGVTLRRMNDLAGKHIVLGLTGGIACYKSAELCRLLVKAGASVQVVMTAAAEQFITPVTMQALSQRPVMCCRNGMLAKPTTWRTST
jgi:hypothetical protein